MLRNLGTPSFACTTPAIDSLLDARMLYRLWSFIMYLLGYGQAMDATPPIPAGDVSIDLSNDVRKIEDFCSHSGEFADIWKVRWEYTGSSGKVYAAKVIREIVTDARRRENVSKRLREVYELWHRLTKDKHPNIVLFYGYVNGFGCFPSAVIPYYENGNAMAYTLKNPGTDKRQIMADIAAGLLYVHTLPEKISHGNLKASNVLISKDGRASISDIRLYLIVSQSDFTTSYVAGSCRWAAPEIMDPPEEAETDECDFAYATSTAADVYAFGMTTLEIYTGKQPFGHKRNDAAVVLDVMKGLRPFRPEISEVTDELWQLMQDCWVTSPSARPNMTEVVVRVGSLGSKT